MGKKDDLVWIESPLFRDTDRVMVMPREMVSPNWLRSWKERGRPEGSLLQTNHGCPHLRLDDPGFERSVANAVLLRSQED